MWLLFLRLQRKLPPTTHPRIVTNRCAPSSNSWSWMVDGHDVPHCHWFHDSETFADGFCCHVHEDDDVVAAVVLAVATTGSWVGVVLAVPWNLLFVPDSCLIVAAAADEEMFDDGYCCCF